MDQYEKDQNPWTPDEEVFERLDRDLGQEASDSVREYFKKSS